MTWKNKNNRLFDDGGALDSQTTESQYIDHLITTKMRHHLRCSSGIAKSIPLPKTPIKRESNIMLITPSPVTNSPTITPIKFEPMVTYILSSPDTKLAQLPERALSVRYKERYLKACAQRSLCRRYIAQLFEAQLLCNWDNRSIT